MLCVVKSEARWPWPQLTLALISVSLLCLAFIFYPAGPEAGSTLRSLLKPGDNHQKATPVIDKPAHSILSQQQEVPLPKLALSFDDGPNPLTTPLILDALEKEHVKASFFVVGSRVEGSENILQRMYRDGFDIGNHSWSHPSFDDLTQQQIISQINQTQEAVARAGVPAPFMFRPPYGIIGKNFPDKLPLAVILWNIDPRDWADHDVKSLTQAIIKQAKPGGIIDLHGIYLSTAQAVAPAIKELKKHYQLVTVSELLGIKPGDTGKYYQQN